MKPILRIGFVQLVDAAPLIAAAELGLFAEEGLDVRLQRQIGWGNVRDKLTFGQLEAAHTLVGMPLCSAVGVDWFVQPLVALMNLGSGGNAITVSRRLADRGVSSAESLAAYLARLGPSTRPVFAHVFGCSMHHYLLRQWLSMAQIDPDRDVSLGILPPQQMPGHMSKGYIDGFCVGEPHNTVAASEKVGRIVAATTDLLPAHPEKSLVVTRPWAEANADVLPPLLRAIIRACKFCDQEENHSKLARMLALPAYLDMDARLILASLKLTDSSQKRVLSMSPKRTFPSGTHHLWLLREMIRWQHVDVVIDPMSIARQCVYSSPYRTVAAELSLDVPADDFPDMPVLGGRISAAALADAIKKRTATITASTTSKTSHHPQIPAGVSS